MNAFVRQILNILIISISPFKHSEQMTISKNYIKHAYFMWEGEGMRGLIESMV